MQKVLTWSNSFVSYNGLRYPNQFMPVNCNSFIEVVVTNQIMQRRCHWSTLLVNFILLDNLGTCNCSQIWHNTVTFLFRNWCMWNNFLSSQRLFIAHHCLRLFAYGRHFTIHVLVQIWLCLFKSGGLYPSVFHSLLCLSPLLTTSRFGCVCSDGVDFPLILCIFCLQRFAIDYKAE